jgi:potassium/sodium efflux P-type ATPase
MIQNQENEKPHWHNLTSDEVISYLNTSSSEGLTHNQASERLKKYGLNEIAFVTAIPWIRIFFNQFNNSLVYLLIGSCFLSIVLGKLQDSLAIFLVIILNVLIGFFQEYKSNIAVGSLLKMIPQNSVVIRDGKMETIKSNQLVAGDLIFLVAGDKIPCDARLIEVKNLQIDEASLTGESELVAKRIQNVDCNKVVAEQKCMVFSGTLVATGSCRAIVVEIGLATQFGKISKLLKEVKSQDTPLNLALKNISKWISIFVVLIAFVQTLVSYLRGYTLVDSILASIALAVATIPEGLPATITIAAAIGVERMAKRNAIIKHLLTVETLGSTSVICTDKTGTLTKNEMTVQGIWNRNNTYMVSGVGYNDEGKISKVNSKHTTEQITQDIHNILLACVLCNDSSLRFENSKPIYTGDSTEIALLVLAKKGNLDQKLAQNEFSRLDVIPFESERRFMASLNKYDEKFNTLYLKGAPEVLACKLSEDIKDDIYKQLNDYAQEGMRVLMLAKKMLPKDKQTIEESDLKDGFEFLGLVGIIDPPRLEVFDAIKCCQEAGIELKMITGDHPLTALKIAKELQLTTKDEVLLGYDIESYTQEELKEKICQYEVVARALPEHKLKIVEALQSLGKVTAMTGDGVNDAPALKLADIGVSMNITGTEVAKEASDMILADDNFQSIKAAVEEGRRVYDNLIKSITFMFPTNMALALVILISVLFFPIESGFLLMPILPAQILWINLIVAVALSLPLCFEAMEPDVMKRAPRKKNATILDKILISKTLFVGFLITSATLALFLYEYYLDINAGLNPIDSLKEAQTMSVTTVVFFQVFYVLNCRSLKHSFFKMGVFSNKYVIFGITFVILSHLGFVYFPFMNEFFGSHPIKIESLIYSILVAFMILPLAGLQKKWINFMNKKNNLL